MAGQIKMRLALALIGIALTGASAALAGQPYPMPSPLPPPIATVEGVWLTETLTEMTITQCPDGFCGYISKIVVPEKYKAEYGAQLDKLDPSTYQDVNNKDAKLRNRPILGLQILTLKPTGNRNYYDGEIYNPEDGNIYSGSVEVQSTNEVKLKGCVLYVLCQEQLWERAPPTPPVAQ